MLKRTSVSVTEEKRICIGLIVSTEFFEKVKPIFKIEYFTNSYLKIVSSWCDSFFEQYKKAPYFHIKDIFESQKRNLSETEAEMIETLLKDLDSFYSKDEINVDYWFEQATDYFRSRELEIAVNNISVLKDKGDIEEAEKEIENFKNISAKLKSNLIINPGNIEIQEEIYQKIAKTEKGFFKLPGDLGRYLGNMKRGDLIAFQAPAKRGKCASGDSLIYMADGTIKTLKYVVENRLSDILCVNKNLKIIKGKVTNWIKSGRKKEFEITTRTGAKIKTSKDHKFYTPEGWKKLSELAEGSLIALSKNIKTEQKNELLGKEFLKVFAYLIADGHLGHTVSFTKFDKEIREDFISCVDFFKDSYRLLPKEGGLDLHKGKITSLLDEQGLRNKLSADKFIPDCIMKSSNENISLFLNILFTCDGSIWKDRNNVIIEYSSKSQYLINQISFCLNRFNIFPKRFIKIVKGTNYYTILLSSNSNIQKFIDSIGFSFYKKEKVEKFCQNLDLRRDYIDVIPHKFVKEVGDFLRKQKIGPNNETFRKAYVNKIPLSRYSFSLIAGKNHPILNTDVFWDKVKSIEEGSFSEMYDLTVEENHNFIADSFIVHNSFSLVNFLKYGILSRKKTLFFSIEMIDTEILPRLNKAFNPMIDEENLNGTYTYPVFDCLNNQTGQCADRNSSVTVYVDKKIIPNPTHIVCTKCRNHPNKEERKRFRMSTFFEKINREVHDIFTIRKNFKSNKQLFDRYCRISVHPKYTLTYEKMLQDIEHLWVRERWAPDITIIDYVDILGINSKFDDFRLDDEKWKLLAKYAGKFNNLVITATQANKAGHTAEVLDSTHLGGFYGKNRHVTMMIGLNQKPDEKEKGIINFGISEARFKKYIPGKVCTVLQDLESGQAYLDSHYDY